MTPNFPHTSSLSPHWVPPDVSNALTGPTTRRLVKQDYTLQSYKDALVSILILKGSILCIAYLAYTCQSCLASSFLVLLEVL